MKCTMPGTQYIKAIMPINTETAAAGETSERSRALRDKYRGSKSGAGARKSPCTFFRVQPSPGLGICLILSKTMNRGTMPNTGQTSHR